jgi:hypothetical protein
MDRHALSQQRLRSAEQAVASIKSGQYRFMMSAWSNLSPLDIWLVFAPS